MRASKMIWWVVAAVIASWTCVPAEAWSIFGKPRAKGAVVAPVQWTVEVAARDEDGSRTYDGMLKDPGGKDLWKVTVTPKEGAMAGATGVLGWEVKVFDPKKPETNLLAPVPKAGLRPFQIMAWDVSSPGGGLYNAPRVFLLANKAVEFTITVDRWSSDDGKTMNSLNLTLNAKNKS